MATDKEQTQRRVYVLPIELVNRIVEFQEEKGIPSEVEAVRRLLDDALKSRDRPTHIVEKFQAKYEETKSFSEAARDILVGHPLVTKIEFGDNSISFDMKGDRTCVVKQDGIAYEYNDKGELEEWIPFL